MPFVETNLTHDVLSPPELAPSGFTAHKLVEFPDIGHADLLECPQDAIRIVSTFFKQHVE